MKSTESRFLFPCISQAMMNDNHSKAKRPLQFLAKIKRAVKLENRVDSTPEKSLNVSLMVMKEICTNSKSISRINQPRNRACVSVDKPAGRGFHRQSYFTIKQGGRDSSLNLLSYGTWGKDSCPMCKLEEQREKNIIHNSSKKKKKKRKLCVSFNEPEL